MLGNLHLRLTNSSAPTPRERAAILFGTTTATIGAMASTVALVATQRSISSIFTSVPVQLAGLALERMPNVSSLKPGTKVTGLERLS